MFVIRGAAAPGAKERFGFDDVERRQCSLHSEDVDISANPGDAVVRFLHITSSFLLRVLECVYVCAGKLSGKVRMSHNLTKQHPSAP